MSTIRLINGSCAEQEVDVVLCVFSSREVPSAQAAYDAVIRADL